MKLHRSALMAGLLALGVAACGDDVQVVEPTPPPPPPLAATMAPGSATVAVGNSAVFAVNTTGGAAGATASWTCSSSNTGIASVTTTATGCQATGVALGGVTITAVVTKGDETTNVGAQLTVTDDAGAVVTINSINQGGVPAISPFGGQLDVVINVERGDQVLQQLDLLVDGEVVASQTFASTVAADDDAEEQAIQTITLSFNTALYDVLTGAVEYLNGQHIISAQLTVVGAATPVASNTIAIILANADGYHVTADMGDNTALDAAGLQWWGGPTNGTIDISVLPVNYSGKTTESVSVAYCGAAAITVAAAPFDFAFGGVAVGPPADPCLGYSTAGGPVAFAATDAPIITSVQNGTVGPVVNLFAVPATAPLNADHGFPAPIDFAGPGAPAFAENPNGRQNGWINAAVGLTGSNTSATDNDWLINGVADTGVGGYNRMLRLDTTAPGTIAAALAAAPSGAPALPAPTVNNNDICAVASATDNLGNESALPGPGTTPCAQPALGPGPTPVGSHLRAGVDIMAPTIAWVNAPFLTANARIATPTVGAEYQVTVSDVGAVGNSGMLSGGPVSGRLTVRSAATTVCGATVPPAAAPLPGQTVMGACTNTTNLIAGHAGEWGIAFPLVTTANVTPLTTPAYYTLWAMSHDAAGNSSAEINRVVVRDNLAVTATPPAVPVTITGSFSANAFLNDDLSVRDYYWTAGFGGGLTVVPTIRLAAAPTVVDAYDAPTLNHTNFNVNTVVNTFLGLQDGSAAPVGAYVAGANPLAAVNLFARDQTQAAYTGPSTAGVAPTAPAAGIPVTSVAPAWTFMSYVAATSNAVVCAGVVTTAGTCPVTTTTTTLSVAATGTTATFPNPFTRVDFYIVDAAVADMRLIGSVAGSAATLVDDGATRVWTYSLATSGSALYSLIEGVSPTDYTGGNFRLVYAFGVNAAGNVALVSAGLAQSIDSGSP